MLWLFEHVNFSTLLIDFDRFHVFFVNRLYRNFLSSLFVSGKLNKAKLTFTEILFKIVVIEHIGVANSCFESFEPLILHFLRFEVKYAWFIWRQYDLDWVKSTVLRYTVLRFHVLDECSNQRMHDAVLLVLWIAVTIEIITSYDGPVLFIPIGLCFQITLTLKLLFFMRFVVSKSLKWLDWILNVTFILSLIGCKSIGCGHVKLWVNLDCAFINIRFVAELAHTNSKCFLWVYWWELPFQFIEISFITNLTAYGHWLFRIIIPTQFMASYNFMWTLWSCTWKLLVVNRVWS